MLGEVPLFKQLPHGGENMAERKNSEARIKSNNKWTNAHYDRINLAVPKGRKAEIQALAEAEGQSVNGFIIGAIDEKLERDGAGGPQEAAGAATVAGGISLPLDALEAAQQAAERTGEAVGDFLARAALAQAKRDEISLHTEIGRAHV